MTKASIIRESIISPVLVFMIALTTNHCSAANKMFTGNDFDKDKIILYIADDNISKNLNATYYIAGGEVFRTESPKPVQHSNLRGETKNADRPDEAVSYSALGWTGFDDNYFVFADEGNFLDELYRTPFKIPVNWS